jgi:IclR family transcriptional regulator, acetate operon repressor
MHYDEQWCDDPDHAVKVARSRGDMGNAEKAGRGPLVKSADRALDLLELISAFPEQLTFSQIAEAVAMPKSSLSQLLSNLASRGYVEVDGNRGKYRLGRKLSELSATAQASLPFGQVLQKIIEKLRDEINETVAYYEQREDEVEIIAAIPTRHALLYTMTLGERAPLYAHSAGKIALSFMTDSEIEAYLNRVEIKRLGPKTLRSKDAIRREIGKVRKTGIAFASEEFAPGICGFAAPIVVGTRLRGALNVAIPIARFTADIEASIKLRLPRCAEDIARSAAQNRLSR